MMNRRSFLAGSLLAPLAPTALWADGRERKIGFILVGVSWCGACKTAAPILSLFCERRDISCVYAAPDQTPISPFSTYLDARGHPLMTTVKYYPTTLLYSARADAVIAQISGFKNMPFYRSQLEALVELAVRGKHVG